MEFIYFFFLILQCLDDRSVRDSERKAALMHFSTDQVMKYKSKYKKVGVQVVSRAQVAYWVHCTYATHFARIAFQVRAEHLRARQTFQTGNYSVVISVAIFIL